jgi:uncharacterized protein YdaT
MPLETEVPKYDPDAMQDFLDEGYSETEAIRILSTTMDGANETRTGEIDSTQTACDTLDYDETLEESKEVKRARKRSESLVRAELGLKKDEDIDSAVDAWIAEQERKLGRK